jgi:SAM-dependent methyltransferase
MHVNSLLIFREHVAHRIGGEDRVLEIGPDGDPSTFCREAGLPPRWESADLAEQAGAWSVDSSKASILMPNEYEIPVPDGSYDVVFSAQVAEHVQEIWTWMRELARVTKPGGQVITISPISWTYHEAPVDCWRMYPAGMGALSRFAGLAVEHSWWGSLEPAPSRRTYPGTGEAQIWGLAPSRRGGRWADMVRRAVGWPMPVAYDMVTVARKR